MRKSPRDARKSGSRQSPAISCWHCGRPMSAAGCANLHCPGIGWQAMRAKDVNTVELRPSVQRSLSGQEFVGSLYAKEVRVVDGCRCQGVSASTVAFGPDKKQVAEQIAAAALRHAQLYAHRGYKVTLRKLTAA